MSSKSEQATTNTASSSSLPQMPTQLAEKLAAEQQQFEKHLTPSQLTESLESASKRHEQVVHQTQMNAHDQVEHAREVAATHESRPEDNVPGRVLHSQEEKLVPLEAAVESNITE